MCQIALISPCISPTPCWDRSGWLRELWLGSLLLVGFRLGGLGMGALYTHALLLGGSRLAGRSGVDLVRFRCGFALGSMAVFDRARFA